MRAMVWLDKTVRQFTEAKEAKDNLNSRMKQCELKKLIIKSGKNLPDENTKRLK